MAIMKQPSVLGNTWQKCTKPLEAEDCFWSEANQKQSKRYQGAEFYCLLSLEVDSSPDKYQYENVQPGQLDCNFERL